MAKASGTEVTAGPGGFDLGTMTGSTRTTTHRRSWRLRAAERNDVEVTAESDLAGDTTFVAPLIPLERLSASVFLPGGDRARDRGAKVTASCRARPFRTGEPLEACREIPVNVKVELVGYETLEFAWFEEEGEPDRILIPVR